MDAVWMNFIVSLTTLAFALAAWLRSRTNSKEIKENTIITRIGLSQSATAAKTAISTADKVEAATQIQNEKIDENTKRLNGRLDTLIQAVRDAAYAEGHAQGRESTRKPEGDGT